VLSVAITSTVVVLLTFALTTLVEEPATAVALAVILLLSVALDLGWKRTRDRASAPDDHRRSSLTDDAWTDTIGQTRGMGPVEYVVIGFPGNRFKGEIVPALAELVDNDVVRIIDVAFIKKDADGNATMFEYDSLDDVLAFGFADVDGEAGAVLNDEDLELAAEALEPDSSAALIVWEHRWAARVAQAIRDAGGRIVAGERVPDEIVEQALTDLGPGD
jgi:hypothetical protein